MRVDTDKDNNDVAVLQAQEPEKQDLCATPTCLTGSSVSRQPFPNIAQLHARCTCSRNSFLLMACLYLGHPQIHACLSMNRQSAGTNFSRSLLRRSVLAKDRGVSSTNQKLHKSLTWVNDNVSIRLSTPTLWLRKLLCTCREASGLSNLLVPSPCVHLHLHLHPLDPVSG